MYCEPMTTATNEPDQPTPASTNVFTLTFEADGFVTKATPPDEGETL